MTENLNGKRIAFLVANAGVEQVELTSPWQRLTDAGGQPVLIAPEKSEVQAMNGDIDKGDTFTPDLALTTDIRNAGGTWEDNEVVTSTGGGYPLVTSRKPDDLDAFNDALTTTISNQG